MVASWNYLPGKVCVPVWHDRALPARAGYEDLSVLLREYHSPLVDWDHPRCDFSLIKQREKGPQKVHSECTGFFHCGMPKWCERCQAFYLAKGWVRVCRGVGHLVILCVFGEDLDKSKVPFCIDHSCDIWQVIGPPKSASLSCDQTCSFSELKCHIRCQKHKQKCKIPSALTACHVDVQKKDIPELNCIQQSWYLAKRFSVYPGNDSITSLKTSIWFGLRFGRLLLVYGREYETGDQDHHSRFGQRIHLPVKDEGQEMGAWGPASLDSNVQKHVEKGVCISARKLSVWGPSTNPPCPNPGWIRTSLHRNSLDGATMDSTPVKPYSIDVNVLHGQFNSIAKALSSSSLYLVTSL